MLKIDWTKFIEDHVWFGWFVNIDYKRYPPGTANYEYRHSLYWVCSDRWHERLWPMRRYGQWLPPWWLKIWRVV